MRNNLLIKKQIIDTLAEKLDDALLTQLFPGTSPQEVRSTLKGKQPGKPEKIPTGTSSSQSSEVKQDGLCRLFTDGASRGNPGQAGAGAVLFSQDGQELITCSDYLGICTNNVAEYKALILGLKAALDERCLSLEINLDSELIVRQIQGRYKVKNEALKLLYTDVMTVLKNFPAWSVNHVPRSQNARADALANQGIDQKQGVVRK